MEVIIRAFRQEDVDALYFMDRRCYAPPYRFAYHQLVSTLLDRDVLALVAEAQGWKQSGVIGALIVRGEPWERRMTIVSLMVEEPFRRQGLGRSLLARARRLARGGGVPVLTVPMEAGNPAGANFLAACGFRDTGEGGVFFPRAEQGTVWHLEVKEEAEP